MSKRKANEEFSEIIDWIAGLSVNEERVLEISESRELPDDM